MLRSYHTDPVLSYGPRPNIRTPHKLIRRRDPDEASRPPLTAYRSQTSRRADNKLNSYRSVGDPANWSHDLIATPQPVNSGPDPYRAPHRLQVCISHIKSTLLSFLNNESPWEDAIPPLNNESDGQTLTRVSLTFVFVSLFVLFGPATQRALLNS